MGGLFGFGGFEIWCVEDGFGGGCGRSGFGDGLESVYIGLVWGEVYDCSVSL